MTPHPRIRILLVDDHPLVIEGIIARFEDEESIVVVGQAGSGHEALEQARATRPDVVLMDVSMPDMDGIEAMRQLKMELPEIKVLILSMHDEQEYVVRLMQLGATGYVLKDIGSDELLKAIEAVYQGSTYFSAGISQSLFSRFDEARLTTDELLTKREEEVIKLIAEGECNKNIARILDISVRTVETHRHNIKKKLGIHSAAGLTRYAIENGLVKLT